MWFVRKNHSQTKNVKWLVWHMVGLPKQMCIGKDRRSHHKVMSFLTLRVMNPDFWTVQVTR